MAPRRNRGKLGTRSGLYYEPDHPISDGTKVEEGKVMYSLLVLILNLGSPFEWGFWVGGGTKDNSFLDNTRTMGDIID